MPIALWIAAGGALGAVSRHFINQMVGRMLGSAFPWHTLLVNVTGCFIMGLLVELMARRLDVSVEARAFLTTGILGGFTTFSAFSLDFALLVERKAYAAAFGYCAASVGLSLAAVFAGLAIVRAIAP